MEYSQTIRPEYHIIYVIVVLQVTTNDVVLIMHTCLTTSQCSVVNV